MCVVKSTRPRRKVHACARFANTQSFFFFSRQHTSLDDHGPRKEAERVY